MLTKGLTALPSLWYVATSPRHVPQHLDIPSEHGRVRTLADMTEDEIARLETELGAPIRRPVRG